MYLWGGRLWLLISCFLIISVQLSSSHVVGPIRRQDDSSPSPTPSPTRRGSAIPPDLISPTAISTPPSSSTPEAVSSSISHPEELPSELPESNALNSTTPRGQLPLQPSVTPGWGVAGVLLLGSGVVYTLIGIKNDRLHTFFSTAYLGALGTTVLIIYIMQPPIALGIQGAYVVAITVTGLVLGAIAMFFRDMTEGLGCLLGGFCLSMWLLCLKPGGLLAPGSMGTVILISCFAVVTFGLYFTRWTRDYTLIFAISFSGATVTVLGIDCFSRAGLKEYWAYMWGLNEYIFPVGTDTYPLTRGIEVELAAVVILALAGIISQSKIWRIVKRRQADKEEQRAQGRRHLEEEEAVIGQKIGIDNARARRIWERTYGEAYAPSVAGSNDSGYANGGDPEKTRDGVSSGKKTRPGSAVQVHVFEMDDMASHDQPPPVPSKQSEPVMTPASRPPIVVRLGQDDMPIKPTEAHVACSPEISEKRAAAHAQLTAGRAGSDHLDVASPTSAVPSESHVDETRSVYEQPPAAMPADDEIQAPPKVQQRRSLAHRLSRMSSDKLRRMSQRDSMTTQMENPSQEELVASRPKEDVDNRSIAATLDLDSVDGDARSLAEASRRSLESDAPVRREQAAQVSETTSETGTVKAANEKPSQADETAHEEHDAVVTNSKRTSQGSHMTAEASQAASSAKSAGSVLASLSRERLPQALSKVALSYRTDEWAKHLSSAEAPVPDTLQPNDSAPEESMMESEAAKPVHMAELQQTAETGAPAPHGPLSRTNSQLSVAMSHLRSPQVGTPVVSRQASMAGMRRSSTNLHTQPISEVAQSPRAGVVPRSPSSGSSSSINQVVPGVQNFNSPQSLIAQRELYLRSKSNNNLAGSMTMPNLYSAQQQAPSEAGSMYNYYPVGADVDDLPLSQRREVMRRSSMLQVSDSFGARSSSGSMLYSSGMSGQIAPSGFDSHQPQRQSTLPSQAARASQLAAFRQSVQADIQSGTPSMAQGPQARASYAAGLGSWGSGAGMDREAEVQRSIDAQRAMLMEQKAAVAQRKEMDRLGRERDDRAFVSMMQSGQWNDAHRDMLRRMQSKAQDKTTTR